MSSSQWAGIHFGNRFLSFMFGLMTLALPQSGPFIEITPEVPFRKQITGFAGSDGAGAAGAALAAALGFGAAEGGGTGAGAATGALDATGGGFDGAIGGAG